MPWTFEHLYNEKLYSGHDKCEFGQTQVEYLGHIIGGGVIAVNPAKMHIIIDWPEPTYVKHVLTVSQVGYLLLLVCIAVFKDSSTII